MEQGRVSRRAKYAKASYQVLDNYRALTWLTRSHLGDDGWAPAAPAPPEARLAVQTVQVATIECKIITIEYKIISAGI